METTPEKQPTTREAIDFGDSGLGLMLVVLLVLTVVAALAT